MSGGRERRGDDWRPAAALAGPAPSPSHQLREPYARRTVSRRGRLRDLTGVQATLPGLYTDQAGARRDQEPEP